MARTVRIKSRGEGTAYYHLVSRAVNRQFLFAKSSAKDNMLKLARKAAEFSGVKLIAVTIMDNHFHILCSVTRTDVPVPREELIRRVGVLKGEKAAEDLAEHWDELEAAGLTSTLEGHMNRLRVRMNDISAFMKTMKELYSMWYNRKYDYSGSIWSGVFKSTMIESGRYLEYCHRYILMNPIRAGIVNQIKDYRWVWSENLEENSLSLGCLPGGDGNYSGSLPSREGDGATGMGAAGGRANGAGYAQNGTVGIALGGWGTGAAGRRLPQIGAGKIFGSMEFVLRQEDEIWASIRSFRRVTHPVKVYGSDGSVIEEIGFSSHGWRLAKKELARRI